MMSHKYVVVLKNPDGSDDIHSKHENEHDALEKLYAVGRFRKDARIEFSDYANRKHDFDSIEKHGHKLIMGLFTRLSSDGSATFENEKALDDLAGVIMQMGDIHRESMDKAQHEINALIW
jgi:hypothetical protein